MKLQNRRFEVMALVGALVISGCGKSEEGGTTSSSPIPSMVTIAKATLPSTLESSAVGKMPFFKLSNMVDSNLTELKDRIFSPGPTDFMYRLKMVDERLDSLADAITQCEGTATQSVTPPAVATGFSFPMELACVQTVDAASLGVSDFKVYFGKSGGYWYVAELQTNAGFETSDGEPPTMGVLSKINETGADMEVFQISVEKKSGSYYSSVTQIKADQTNGVFELSSASSADQTQTISPGANFTGVGCGVSMKTNGTNVYASGSFGQMTSCPATATVCADAATLSDSPGACGSLTSISTLGLERADVSGNQAKSLVVDRTWVSGI